jgi:polyisoprenoid-binding protein YceI
MRKIIAASLMIFSLAAMVRADNVYTFDTDHTSIGFAIKHMVISTVRGRYNSFSGSIVLDEKAPVNSSVKVVIKAASIDTGILKRDEHLRSADFFDVMKYPDITFVSKKIEKRGSSYEMTGTLTMKGVSKDVSFPFSLSGPMKDPWGNSRVGAEATLVINRLDYGVAWNKAIEGGGLMVGNDVKIELSVEGVKK